MSGSEGLMARLKDPLNVRQYGSTHYNRITLLVYSVPLCLLLSLMFLLISYSSTQAAQVTQFDDNVYTWENDKYPELVKANAARMKLMPSVGHGVAYHMLMDNQESEFFQKALIDSGKSLVEYQRAYYIYPGKTAEFFAELDFDGSMVPVGNASPKCLHIKMSPFAQQFWEDQWKAPENLPTCKQSSIKAAWAAHDPTTGIDVEPWKQIIIPTSCYGDVCDECTQNKGWWTGTTCYGYKVIDTLCVAVQRYFDKFNEEHWRFMGGCFAGKAEHFTTAEPGKVYLFDKMRIEVRLWEDPFVQLMNATGGHLHLGPGGTVSFVFSIVFFLGAIGCAVLVRHFYMKMKNEEDGPYQQH